MHFISTTSLRGSEIREASVFFTDFNEKNYPLHNLMHTFTPAHVPPEIKPFLMESISCNVKNLRNHKGRLTSTSGPVFYC